MCRFAITCKNNAFVVKIVDTRLTKVLWSFMPSPNAANFCHPGWFSPLVSLYNESVLLALLAIAGKQWSSSKDSQL